MMQCKEVIKHIEEWAPKAIAWDKDNVGLQVGTTRRKIKNVMLSLDLNEKVIEQALKKKCNFIITHHPLLFNPLDVRFFYESFLLFPVNQKVFCRRKDTQYILFWIF